MKMSIAQYRGLRKEGREKERNDGNVLKEKREM